MAGVNRRGRRNVSFLCKLPHSSSSLLAKRGGTNPVSLFTRLPSLDDPLPASPSVSLPYSHTPLLLAQPRRLVGTGLLGFPWLCINARGNINGRRNAAREYSSSSNKDKSDGGNSDGE